MSVPRGENTVGDQKKMDDVLQSNNDLQNFIQMMFSSMASSASAKVKNTTYIGTVAMGESSGLRKGMTNSAEVDSGTLQSYDRRRDGIDILPGKQKDVDDEIIQRRLKKSGTETKVCVEKTVKLFVIVLLSLEHISRPRIVWM